MTITTIKQQVKNPNRASIFIDGKYTLSLSIDELVANRLKIGQVVDEPLLASLKKQSADGKTRSRSMDWVLNRPRSVREFRQYLLRKRVDKELADKLEREFLDKGHLNDERFATWLVDVRQRSGKSQRLITAELSSKGVSREIISGIDFDQSDEVFKIRTLVAKKLHASKYANDESKLIKYLLGKGFGYSDIRQIIDEHRID
ncbi:RecX family transcriptional regulator [Candidatus Saccharibacteria bacterium]|nr:RecX family transcriptional regulator [Candidatus Saccharibacteria bacterium]